MIKASIVGGAGFAGGELIRLLHGHPEVQIGQVASRSRAGKFVHSMNPNLRQQLSLKYCAPAQLTACDVLFLCLPHGEAVESIDRYMELAPRIIDLSADFRLDNPSAYASAYGGSHNRPDLLGEFVYGIAELNRDRIAQSNYVACAGCNATAVILALWPIVQSCAVESVVAEVKVGSSEAGRQANEASHHPLRSGAVRSYRPTGHRHVAEMRQALNIESISFSATSIEMVRGIVATCHVFAQQPLPNERELWKIYRHTYQSEPFVRIVKDRSGIHRYPEPRHLGGTNFCDVGFERDADNNRIVVISALDNLMKGAAGQAVQNLNLMHGLGEQTGLEFTGLFPA